MLVVMIDVCLDDSLEMPPRHDQYPVKALMSDRSDPSLRERVCLGRPNRCWDDLEALAPENLIERARELRVIVPNEELKAVICFVEVDREVFRLLSDPFGIGSCRAPAEMDAPARMLDEEQDVDPLEPQGLNSKEVTSDDAVSLLG